MKIFFDASEHPPSIYHLLMGWLRADLRVFVLLVLVVVYRSEIFNAKWIFLAKILGHAGNLLY